MPCKPADCARDRTRPPHFEFCSIICTPKCSHRCFRIPNIPIVNPSPPPPQPLLPSSDSRPQAKTLLLLSLITTATLLGAIFVVCLLFKKFKEHRRSTRNGPALFDVRRANLPDDDYAGPILDHHHHHHHVWFINTVGLQQSVIDSITMFKYRKDEKFIDGSDCSICLGEFQDDESLRLLPKCSHAFHVLCIDTWLRSHKNCPLCRALVASNEPITDQPPLVEDAQVETEAAVEENREIPITGLLGDLTENQNPNQNQNEAIAMRRSVSMDSVSAMAVYQATANLEIREDGSSSNSISNSRNVPFAKRGVGNQRLYNLVKSISMKRFSSGRRKLEWGRHYRSQSSILPL